MFRELLSLSSISFSASCNWLIYKCKFCSPSSKHHVQKQMHLQPQYTPHKYQVVNDQDPSIDQKIISKSLSHSRYDRQKRSSSPPASETIYDRSPRRRRASWMSLDWIVTRLAWMAHRLVSSKRETRYASTDSWRAPMADDWNRRSDLKSWAISRTNRWKGSFRIKSSVDFW